MIPDSRLEIEKAFQSGIRNLESRISNQNSHHDIGYRLVRSDERALSLGMLR